MSKEYLLKQPWLRSALFILLVVTASTATATHFRFGHFTWEPRPDVSDATVDFNLTVAFRSSYFGNPDIGQTFRPGTFYFGDGRAASHNFEVIAHNRQEDWIVGRAINPGSESGVVRHTYPSPNNNGAPWKAYHSGCCRISTLRNSRDTNWYVATEVNLADDNRSPVSNLPPIVTCSKYNCSFRIPAVDRDRDPLRWRMSTTAESGIRSIPAGMAVDPDTGMFSWEGSSNFSNGLYAVQVTIEDLDESGNKKSSTALDFIINLQESGANAWPEFDSPPTPPAGSRIVAVVGQTLTQLVQATDPDAADEVFLNHVGLPTGATFDQTVTGGAIGQATLEWTPTTADLGEHIVTFLANDNRGGAASPVAVTIEVIEPAISNVRIVDALSSDDIVVDASSFSRQPDRIDVLDGKTVVTWRFPTFKVGQVESLVTDLSLHNLDPGEQRLVSHQVDVYYTDMNGDEVHQTLGELVAKVAPTTTSANVATDKTVYGPDEQVTISSAVKNLSDIPVDARVMISVEDNQGSTASSFGPFLVEGIAAMGTIGLDEVEFATNGVYVGMYEAVASIVDDYGRILRRAATPFSIVTEFGDLLNLGSTVSTDKPVYQAWDQVIVEARAQNLATNSSFNGGSGSLRVLDESSGVVFQESVTVGSLVPSDITTRQFQLPLTDSGAGTYLVQWSVSAEGQVLTSSQASFEVVRSDLQALVGDVQVTHYETGEPKGCEFSTSNRSSVDSIAADLIYQIIRLEDGSLVDEVLEKDIAVSNAASHSRQVLVLPSLPDYGGYACVLTAEIAGQMQQLGAKGFYLHPPKLEASLTLADRGRLLVLIDAPNYGAPQDASSSADQHDYLVNLLSANAWDHTIVHTAEDFTAEFYSGSYSAVALFAEHVGLHPQTEQLLVEAHNSGLGLLVAGAANRRDNKIERSIGVKLNGNNSGAYAIQLADQVLSDPEFLGATVSHGLVLAHCGSQLWAHFTSGRTANSECSHGGLPEAATAGKYGRGQNAYFAYDLLDAAAVSSDLHEHLLLHALQYIQPGQWSTYSGRVVPVVLEIESTSRTASMDAVFDISGGAIFVDAHQPVHLSEEGAQALWQWDFPRPGTARNILYVEVPATAGAIDISLDLDAGLSRRLMIDHTETQLSFDVKAAPHEETMTLVNLLLESGHNTNHYKLVKKKLQQALAATNRNSHEQALKPLLQAAGELAEDENSTASEARLAIGEWLHQIQRLL